MLIVEHRLTDLFNHEQRAKGRNVECPRRASLPRLQILTAPLHLIKWHLANKMWCQLLENTRGVADSWWEGLQH